LLKDKDQLKPLVESSFMEGLVDATYTAFVDQTKTTEAPPVPA
jgi:hypothetical protein